MDILLFVLSAVAGGFIFYVGVQVGYKLSKGSEPKVEPLKSVIKAVQSAAPKQEKEPDAWEIGMKSILNYDGYKDK